MAPIPVLSLASQRRVIVARRPLDILEEHGTDERTDERGTDSGFRGRHSSRYFTWLLRLAVVLLRGNGKGQSSRCQPRPVATHHFYPCPRGH
jgi:hypothetical protein